MRVEQSHRLNPIKEYYFSVKLKEVGSLVKQGKNIINLGVGSPDLPPHPDVIRALNESSQKDINHKYQPYIGRPELREAFADFYYKHYKVILQPESEILPLIGSKEGLLHVAMSFINPGERVWVPDPGYPSYSSVTQLAGGIPESYKLSSKSGWFPDLLELEKNNPKDVKLMWVNYPHMPTGAVASKSQLSKLVQFALRHNILLVHDTPYGILNSGSSLSLLSIEGAKEIGLELNSLSKTFNMAGWRVGMLAGNSAYIQAVLKFKTNMDSGMFAPVQAGAVAALNLPQEWFDTLHKTYNSRRNLGNKIMSKIGCSVSEKQAGMFVWAKIPENFRDSYELADELLYNKGIFMAPGGIFGTQGLNYIRLSLCSNENLFNEALERLN